MLNLASKLIQEKQTVEEAVAGTKKSSLEGCCLGHVGEENA